MSTISMSGQGANVALDAALPSSPTAISINALIKGQLAYLAPVTSSADTTHFVSSVMIGYGTDYFTGWTAYVLWDAGGAGAAPQGEYRIVSDYVTATGTFTLSAASTQLAATDIVLLVHPFIGGLGLPGDTAATGAVTTTDTAMAYIKQLVTNTEALTGSTNRLATKTSTSNLTSGAIFNFTGTVGIVSITGRVTTAIEDQACTAKLTVTPDALAAYDICAALSIRNFAIGTLLSITGTAADAMVGTTAVGSIAPGQSGLITATCVTSGVISTVFSVADSSGVIVWEVLWIPLSSGATLVAA